MFIIFLLAFFSPIGKRDSLRFQDLLPSGVGFFYRLRSKVEDCSGSHHRGRRGRAERKLFFVFCKTLRRGLCGEVLFSVEPNRKRERAELDRNWQQEKGRKHNSCFSICFLFGWGFCCFFLTCNNTRKLPFLFTVKEKYKNSLGKKI